MANKKEQKSKKEVKSGTNKKQIPFIAYFPWVFLIIILAVAVYYPMESCAVVAKVNGEPICLEEIDRLYNHLSPEEQAAFTKPFLLNATIHEKLLLQVARVEGIIFTEEELGNSVEAYLKDIKFSKEKYELLLAQQNITYDEFLKDYEKQLIISTLITKEITLEIEVSDEEAQSYYNSNIAAYIARKQVKVGHILVESMSEAEDILEQLEDGAEFEALAKENSIDPSAQQNGGILEYAPKGIFVKPFEDLVFSMEIGDMDLVETQFGVHVVKLVDKKPPFQTPFEEVKKDIKGRILAEKQGEYLKVYLGNLRQKAKIEIMNPDI